MTKFEVKRMIEQNATFREFIEGKSASMTFAPCGITVIIYKEIVGAKYYYKLPWYEGVNYDGVRTFMKYAIPILSGIIEAKRREDLMAPGNNFTSTVRYT